MDSQMKLRPQLLVGLGICVSWIISGVVLGYPSPAIPSIQNDPTFHAEESQLFFLGSINSMGAAVGAALGSLFMSKVGRRTFIAACAGSAFGLGFLLVSVGPNMAVVLLGRFVSGVGLAWCFASVPVYITETIHKDVRGSIGFLPELSITAGFLLAYSLGTVLSWRSLSNVGAALLVAFISLTFFLPESPVWLVKMGRVKEAEGVLKRVRGDEYDISRELEEIQTRIKEDEKEGRLSDLLSGWYWRPFLMAAALLLQQQLCGINIVLFFTSTIFSAARTTLDDNVSAIIVGVFRLAGGLSAAFVVDRYGRKPLLILSFVGMSASLVALGTFFQLKAQTPDTPVSWLPLPSLVLYVLFYSLGAGPIPWLYMSEVLPSKVKNVGASVITCTTWSASAVVTITFDPLMDAIGIHWTFWLYSALCLGSALFCGLVLPETRKLSATAIQRLFTPAPDVLVGDSGKLGSEESCGSRP